MFGPDYKAGCPSCSMIADGFNGFTVHLANHDVMLWAVSRAPLAALQAYKARMGWTFPWASSFGSDFNSDFSVAFSEEQQKAGSIEYNYQSGGHAMDANNAPEPVRQFAATCGTDPLTYTRDRPGMSSFVQKDAMVYGGRISGWTARPSAVMSRAESGGDATMNIGDAEHVSVMYQQRNARSRRRKFRGGGDSGGGENVEGDAFSDLRTTDRARNGRHSADPQSCRAH
jgi:hypothetical protein